jgi:8-oxo-dGTP diphosphatase
MVTVDAVVVQKTDGRLKILLIRRKNSPFADSWALPGGFVDKNEDLHDAACRELKEETGVVFDNLMQCGAFGTPGRDPRGHNICIAFTAVTEQKITPQGGDDAKEAALFDIKDLPELAFDHSEIIKKAFLTLKTANKL